MGSCVIDADQAGNARYAAAPEVRQSIRVVKVTHQSYGSGSAGPTPGGG
jgi:hypothetical protein